MATLHQAPPPRIGEKWTCPKCEHFHGTGPIDRASIRYCTGGFWLTLFEHCPAGPHFHVRCTICRAVSFEPAKASEA